MKAKALVLGMFAGLFMAQPSFADDKVAAEKLKLAVETFKGRTEAAKVETAISLLEEAIKEAGDSELKFDSLLLSSRAWYWKAMHTTTDAKRIEGYATGMSKAQEAAALKPTYAEGHYYYAVNLVRWGEAKGAASALGKKKELLATLEKVTQLKTKAGEPGDAYEGYGVDRTLGRLYFKLPALAGGNNKTSLKHLERAATKASDFPLNVVYYAETLVALNQKGKAKEELDTLLAKNPATLNPARVPETVEEFAMAKKLRGELGK